MMKLLILGVKTKTKLCGLSTHICYTSLVPCVYFCCTSPHTFHQGEVCHLVTPGVKSGGSGSSETLDCIETNRHTSFLPAVPSTPHPDFVWPRVKFNMTFCGMWQRRAARARSDKSAEWFSHHSSLKQLLLLTLPSTSPPCINWELGSWQHHFSTVRRLCGNSCTLVHGHTQLHIQTV